MNEGKDKNSFIKKIKVAMRPEVAFALLIAVLVLSVVLLSAFRDRSEVLFGGVFVNTDIDKEGYTYLTDGVMELFNGDPETQKVELTATAVVHTAEYSQINASADAAMQPIAKVEEGNLDYLVMDEEGMMLYMTQYILDDLRTVFSEKELETLGEKVIYLELETDGSRTPVAIRVDERPFFSQHADISNPLFLAFVGPEEKSGHYRAFWDYLNNWNSN